MIAVKWFGAVNTKSLVVTVKITMCVIKPPRTISENQAVKDVCGELEQNYWIR